MSLGRKAIQKTLKTLKQSSVVMIDQWVKSKKLNLEFMSKLKVESPTQPTMVAIQLMQMAVEQARTATMTVSTLVDYIKALEAYVSDLDETFDQLLKSAEKEANEEVKKQPEVPEDLYR